MKHPLPDAALTDHVGVLGKTGSGKTYAAKGIVERLLEQHRRVCVIDPTDAWWGLRSSSDGKAAGYEVLILGGNHADLPLAPASGALVARMVAQQAVNVICCTKLMTVGERTQWFIDFAGELARLNTSPLHLVIDEVHLFAPQARTLDVAGGKMLHAANMIFSGGRSQGLRVLGISQRPAKWHKDSLTSVGTLIAMRVLAPQDREAIREWIDGSGDPVKGKEVLGSLAGLKKGEGWIWYPEGELLDRVTFPRITTFDSSATPTDAAGTAKPKRMAEINLDEIKGAMATAVAEAEANDPKRLRAKVADLTKQLAQAQKTPTSPPKADTAAIQARIAKAVEKATAVHTAALGRASTQLSRALRAAKQALDEVERRVIELAPSEKDLQAAISAASGMQMGREREAPRREAMPAPASAERKTGASDAVGIHGSNPARLRHAAPTREPKGAGSVDPAPGGIQINRTQQRVLDALAFLASIGQVEPDVRAVGLLAGIDPSGGYFSNTVGPLSMGGAIVRGNGRMKLTDIGVNLANAPEAPLTLAEYHHTLVGVVGKKSGASRRLLEVIIERGDQPISSEELGNAAGIDHTGGYFSNSIGPLGTLGLIERRNGMNTPTKVLFPEGLA